jgi:hypothetical protein
MPLPDVRKRETEFGRSGAASAFVSYSHADWDPLVRDFRTQLSLYLDSKPDLSLRSSAVYWERDQIAAASRWNDNITNALETATDFIFLVSHHSLSSEFCVQTELRIALQRGLRIIPIILSACPWRELRHPSFPDRLMLGELAAIPKDAAYNLLPIAEWPDRQRGILTCIEQLGELFASPAQPASGSPFASTRMPRTLPFLCNQKRVENDVVLGLRQWANESLLLLLKGKVEDRGPGFWERLVARELKLRVERHLNAQLGEVRPLEWLDPDTGGADPDRMKMEMLIALSKALAGDPYSIDSSEALSSALTSLDVICPLVATLPRGSATWASASIRALLDVLEACPASTPMNRLVIGLIVEDPALCGVENLRQQFAIPSAGRVCALEPAPLCEFDIEDVRLWHRNNPVDRYTRMDEEQLLAAIFEKEAVLLRFSGLERQLKKLRAL